MFRVVASGVLAALIAIARRPPRKHRGAGNPTPLVTIEFSGERNAGTLPGGAFTQTLIGNCLRINVSTDLSIASYIQ